MRSETHASHWQVIGKSVRGASHERSGTPNQDAIHWVPESGTGSSVVVSVADGHGSTRYCRSHIGSRLAVETATRVVYDFLQAQQGNNNLSITKRAAEEWLPMILARTWLDRVTLDLSTTPLSKDELDSLKQKNAQYSKEAVRSDSSIAYGTTMLIAAVTEEFVLCLQIGDGDILTVSDRGNVSQPIAKDERLFANETTSLCTHDAWREFRVTFQPITKKPPALILLATDGYPNSFRDESGFLKVGSDMLEIVKTDGTARVKEELENWLIESTRAGSGDDVTLGILVSPTLFKSKPVSKGGAAKGRPKKKPSKQRPSTLATGV